MEIPENVQNKLKCSDCDELLSCGPVYLLHESGGAICGRCSQQPEEEDSTENTGRTRNDPYEATASLLTFPCAFAARGCPEKLQFSLGQSPHEIDCKFRPLICPIAPRGSCNWIGSWSKLKEHCNEKHPLNILENPCDILRPDLTTSNLQTYLISAFRFLFLLHIKVCITSGKLFHSVRMFGDSKLLEKFSYTFEIKGNGLKLIKEDSVLRAGILKLQEPTANCFLINSLLGILDGKYNESTFRITIKTLLRNCLICLKDISDPKICPECQKDISDAKFCSECQKELKKCKFNGNSCSFVDVDSNKCLKHEKYFCKYETECCLKCGMNFVDGSFIEHLSSSSYCRERIKSNIDSVVHVTPNTKYTDILFSSNHIGNIICSYYLSDSNFELDLYTSLPSYELKNFKCSVKLTDPQTKHTQHLTPQILYNTTCDWSINEKLDNFPSKNIGIDIKVDIDEI